MLNAKTGIFSPQWLDIVFENRNKDYGAFELRQRSDDRTILAFFSSIGLLTLAVVIPMIISNLAGGATLKPVSVPDVPPENIEGTLVILTPDPKIEAAEKTDSKKSDEKQNATIIGKEGKGTIDPELPPSTPSTGSGTGTTTGTSDSLSGGGGETGTITAKQPSSAEIYDGLTGTMPKFPGGEDALLAFVYKHLQYPAMAVEYGKQGRVMICFVVNQDGSISDVKALNKSIGYGLEDEAMRVIKMLPAWIPGEQNGHKVRVRINMPIHFKLQ